MPGRKHVIAILAFHITGRQAIVVGLVMVFALWATSARSPKKRCRHCHEINREHANYCAQCGKRLTKQ